MVLHRYQNAAGLFAKFNVPLSGIYVQPRPPELIMSEINVPD